MSQTMYVVDAFTKELFKGNAAAVMILDQWLPETMMQAIAIENNLSETAFAMTDESGRYHIRWFSPVTEIAFCGHATLATAYVLFNYYHQNTAIAFYAPEIGHFNVMQLSDGRIEMDFPNLQPEPINNAPEALQTGLSIKPAEYWRNQQAYFAVYDDEAQVRAVSSNDKILKQLAPFDVVVTAPGKQYDCVSRYFWPANGCAEDPATGSIHAGLMPFWGKRLGKNELIALQASARSGVLYGRIEGNRVYISGECVLYSEAEVFVSAKAT